MKAFIKRVLLNNVQLKILSFILAYGSWSMINQSHADDVWIDAPICFYETAQGLKIAAPDHVKVNLSGKRVDLRSLDTQCTAIHIDSRTLKEGDNKIALSEKQVMLPETIKVTGWTPSHLDVKVEQTS